MYPEDKNNLRYFSGGGSALKVISRALEAAGVVRIATAYFEPSGFQCLREVLTGKEVRLLVGRPDTGKDKIREVVQEFVEAITSGHFDNRTAAMEELRNALKQGRFMVSLSEGIPGTTIDPRYLYQHAKLYIADEASAVVCSSNMTYHGLVVSREAGITVTDPDDVSFFISRFDEYYDRAEPIADELLEILEEWLNIYSPYYIYMRSLLEFYGLPSDEKPERLPELAGYQRPVVSRVLRTIEDFQGAMLVASTGLGKTIMAAHVIAYLRMENSVDSAIILCPAGLRNMWQRTMRAARVSSVEFSYYALSVDDWKISRQVEIIERELKYADRKTVIILDESHNLRNQFDGRELRLRNRRIIDAVKRGVKILLMTATPYSRGVADINSQLALLPMYEEHDDLFNESCMTHWSIRSPSDLSTTSNCVVLTAPSVVKHFSLSDESGERYVFFSGNERRFFPRKIHIINRHYENPFDNILIDLLQSSLLLKRSEDHAVCGLFGDELFGKRDPLFESRIVHQFCSSAKQVDVLFNKLQIDEGFEKIRFENQDKLSEYIAGLRPSVLQHLDCTPVENTDPKIAEVINIIKSYPEKTKIVIFCYYKETSRYVLDCLKLHIPGILAETTVEKDPDDLEKIIRRFAPFSNRTNVIDSSEPEYDAPEGETIDVLVATGAMAEGFNLQDASVLINFDLPWTVLVLAQRMGRILRPWPEPREIYIYNLIPSTMEHDDIYMAINWKNRLIERNREFSSFSDLPVMVEKSRGEAFEMIELARSMYDIGDADLDLDEVLEFISNTENLKTTAFIDDLSLTSVNEISFIKKLPPGIRSYKKSNRASSQLYLLLKYGNRLFPAVFNEKGEIIMGSEKMDEIMYLIRSTREEDAFFSEREIERLDSWVEKSRNTWAAHREVMPGEVTIMSMMVLVA